MVFLWYCFIQNLAPHVILGSRAENDPDGEITWDVVLITIDEAQVPATVENLLVGVNHELRHYRQEKVQAWLR